MKVDITFNPTKYYFTVGELRKALRGIPANTPVYTADHDHGHYETNGAVGTVMYLNQRNSEQDIEKDFQIKGNYLVIRVG